MVEGGEGENGEHLSAGVECNERLSLMLTNF